MERKDSLKDTAFVNLQKNLPIRMMKTDEEDIFHSGYRLLDYWIVKETVEEYEKYLNDLSSTLSSEEIAIYRLCRNKFRDLFGDFTEPEEKHE